MTVTYMRNAYGVCIVPIKAGGKEDRIMYQDTAFFAIVNKNHEVAEIMERIDREMEYIELAKKLSQISARRKR